MKGQVGLLAGSVLVIILALLPGLAVAGPADCGPLSQQGCWEAENGKISGGRETRIDPRAGRGAQQVGEQSRSSLRSAMLAAFCSDASDDAVAGGGAPQAVVELCRGFVALAVAPSREQVLRAFRELPLYRGAIRTDPERFTLVNLETYFWCADTAGRGCDLIGEGERQVTLLGQPVRIRPRILSYRWDFGDDTGADITDGRAAHTYQHAGDAAVTLTLTWTADYALGGGAFQPIGDTTTTASPTRTLPVREAEAVIVGGG